MMVATYTVIDFQGNHLGRLTEDWAQLPCVPIIGYGIQRKGLPMLEVDLHWATIGATPYLATDATVEDLLCVPGFQPLKAQA